jgi:hypothetical protein
LIELALIASGDQDSRTAMVFTNGGTRTFCQIADPDVKGGLDFAIQLSSFPRYRVQLSVVILIFIDLPGNFFSVLYKIDNNCVIIHGAFPKSIKNTNKSKRLNTDQLLMKSI